MKKPHQAGFFNAMCNLVPLPHMQATIGQEVLARCVVAFVEFNPRDDGGDFFGLAHAFGLYTCDDFLQNIKANGFGHFGDSVAGLAVLTVMPLTSTVSMLYLKMRFER